MKAFGVFQDGFKIAAQIYREAASLVEKHLIPMIGRLQWNIISANVARNSLFKKILKQRLFLYMFCSILA